MRFHKESMLTISEWLKEALQHDCSVSFEVLNPDLAPGKYAGEEVSIGGKVYLYRGYKAWSDLAESLMCRMLTPCVVDGEHVRLSFEQLNQQDSFHSQEQGREKYGIDSEFSRIHKNEEPAFLAAYKQALEEVGVSARKRVLDLGVNSGEEFELIRMLIHEDSYKQMELVGIDYSASAIARAKQRFGEAHVHFYEHDINRLDELELGLFDLVISIGTFQSPNIDFKPFFMSLVQDYLRKDGAIILGFPNCRWIDGEVIYGARVPNYHFSEMGMLYSDVMFCKKYLQQKKFRVRLTGKQYVFLTATKIGMGTREI